MLTMSKKPNVGDFVNGYTVTEVKNGKVFGIPGKVTRLQIDKDEILGYNFARIQSGTHTPRRRFGD